MSDKLIWHTNDTIQYQQLTAEYVEEATAFMEYAFYPNENVCRTLGLADDAAALKEVKELTQAAAKDGVTVIAIDKYANKIVGAAFNKLQIKGDPVFENFAKTWKQSKAKSIVSFMAYIDNLCNLFDYCQTDCILELMFLATSPEYAGRGIGKKLTEITIEIGVNLVNQVNVKKSVDGTELSLEPIPKIVSAIFTSFITQKIGKQLGFQTAVEIQCNELDFEDLNFDKVVESGTKKLTLEYKTL